MNAWITKPGDISSGAITTFRVDDITGKLTVVGTTAAGTIPRTLTVDPSGQFLYSSDYDNYLRVYKLQADGTPKFVRAVATRSGQLTMAMIPGDSPATYTPDSIFVATAGDDLLTGYVIGRDGSLTGQGSVATPNTPTSLALLPWGTKALATATGAPSTSNIGAYVVSPLTGSSTVSMFLGDAAIAGGVVVEPSEKYAFQSDSSAGVLRTYGNFGSSFWGLLSYDPGNGAPVYSTFPAGAGAGPMAMVPSGRYLYVANQGANSITAFAFWGELFEMTTQYVGGGYPDGSPYAIGAKPIAMAADPMGLYLYVVCDDNSVRVYSIDSLAGGHITKVASLALPATPTSVTSDATGRFLYVGDAAGDVSPFGVDPGTGALTALTPNLLPAAVTAISVESSGQFAYVLCGPAGGSAANNGSINAFKVNTDGTLSTLPAGPWLANHPTAIAFTDSVQ